jgi:hypothetical protein
MHSRLREVNPVTREDAEQAMTASPDRVRRYAGTPREIGLTAGRALGPRLADTIDRYIRERPQGPDALDEDELRLGAVPWLRTLPARFQEELEGLAEGANLPLRRVAEWNYIESCVRDGCSGFVGRIDGRVWIARNNDFFIPGIWGYATIREVVGRIPTLSFGLEGDVFTATGVNRERLWLHAQALTVPDAPRSERPRLASWVLLTEMLETCATIAEVEARLGEIDREDGVLLFVVDGKSDEFAILECECSRHARRSPGGPWLVAANHACVLGGSAPHESSRSRHARMDVLAAELFAREVPARLPGDLIAILADESVERRGPDFATVYAAVGCPSTGELWFTFGGTPAASRGAWQRLPWPW